MKSYLQKHKKILYSDHWSTPQEIYHHYTKVLGYLDPCKLHEEGTDIKNYDFKENMFINPPYSNISEWVDFAINNAYYNKTQIALLIPARTDTRYFHKLLEYGCTIEFIKGRLKFGNSSNSAPFPSIIVHLGIKK